VTVADHMPDQRSSWQWRLLRLRTLVLSEDGLVLPRSIIAEVRDTTNAVITEVEAATRAVLETGSRGPGAETFLWVRVTRLKVAADQAINAARDMIEEIEHVEGVVAVRDRLSYPAKDPRPIPVSGLSFQEPLDLPFRGGSGDDTQRSQFIGLAVRGAPGRGVGDPGPVSHGPFASTDFI